jgi:hypothetical protein
MGRRSIFIATGGGTENGLEDIFCHKRRRMRKEFSHEKHEKHKKEAGLV